MAVNPGDKALYRGLFGDEAAARLFSDRAEIRAMLLVEGALARVQGAAGVIPPEAAQLIDWLAQEVEIDPASLTAGTAQNGVPVPALLAAFRKAAGAREAMAWLHWGATSQDIMDTALALRLLRLLDLWEGRLIMVLQRLAVLAADHADLPMAARTYGQWATPTSFGAVAAGWGWPLLGWHADLPGLRKDVGRVSLSGAAGTLSALGEAGPAIRAGLAAALGLTDPGHDWHADRAGIARLASFAAGLAGSLGKLGEDLLLMTQSGIEEVSLGATGGSSTMPQKANPVGPSVMVALSRQVIGLAGILQGAALHRQARDGAAWFTEGLVLPQMALSTSRLIALASEVLDALRPEPAAMARPLTEGAGLIHAEALVFALAQEMPRPEAQALVTELCGQVAKHGGTLADALAARLPSVVMADPGPALGLAPQEARAFAEAARARVAERGLTPGSDAPADG